MGGVADHHRIFRPGVELAHGLDQHGRVRLARAVVGAVGAVEQVGPAVHGDDGVDAPARLAGGHGDAPALSLQPLQQFGCACVERLDEVGVLVQGLKGDLVVGDQARDLLGRQVGRQLGQALVQAEAHDLAQLVVAGRGEAERGEGLVGGVLQDLAAVHQGAVDVEHDQLAGHRPLPGLAGTRSKAAVRRVASPANGAVPCHM